MENENVLQFQKNESGQKLEIIVFCAGLSKKEVVSTFDKKTGTLEVIGVAEKSNISKVADLDIMGSINIAPKFRSEDVKMKVEDGVAVITFGLSDDVQVIKAD